MRSGFLTGAAFAAALLASPHASATPTAVASPFEARALQAKAAMMADPEAALAQARAALSLADRDTRPEIATATAEWLEGEALMRLNHAEAAAPVVSDGLARAARYAANTKLHGDLTMALGAVAASQGRTQAALENYQAAFRIFGAAGEPRSQAIALQNIGSIYQDAGDYPKVLRYYAQSAELYRGDPALLVSAHNNLGNAFKALGRYAASTGELHKALTLARQMKSPLLELQILENLASTESLAGRLDRAQAALAQAQRIGRTEAGAGERPYLAGIAAQIAQRRGRLAEAARLLDGAFAGRDLGATDVSFRDFHRTAYEVYAALGDDHRALAHLKAFTRLDDEARALAASTNAALMSARFDFANQQARIAQLKTGQLQRDIALARARDAVIRVLLGGALLVSALLAVGILWIRRSRNQVRAANAQLNVANDQLERALAARTEFLATTSHEIRTPLNGILGMTDVLLRDATIDRQVREKVAVVHSAGETMRALVDDILDVAKIETGKLIITRAEMDLGRLLSDTIALWRARAEDKGLALTAEFVDLPDRIVEDEARLRQILFNLMSNAIKFTPAGRVSLSARVERLEEGEQLLLRVADTGIGIPSDRLGEIFEAFSQVDGSTSRTYGGTGLGLTICRNLSVAMGGGMVAESSLGAGSVFEVRLPLERVSASAPAGVVAAVRFEECRLLLVDPNPMSQALVRAVLQPRVSGLECVTSAEGALAAAAAQRFDVAVVDGAALADHPADRFKATRALAEAVAPTHVVVLAAGMGDEDAGALLAAGASQFIRKPIAAPALIAELTAGFEARRPPSPVPARAAG